MKDPFLDSIVHNPDGTIDKDFGFGAGVAAAIMAGCIAFIIAFANLSAGVSATEDRYNALEWKSVSGKIVDLGEQSGDLSPRLQKATITYDYSGQTRQTTQYIGLGFRAGDTLNFAANTNSEVKITSYFTGVPAYDNSGEYIIAAFFSGLIAFGAGIAGIVIFVFGGAYALVVYNQRYLAKQAHASKKPTDLVAA